MGVAPATLSNWEAGRRGRRAGIEPDLDKIAALLGTGPALVDLWKAVGTPAAAAPSRAWSFNPPQPGQAVWAWIRPDTVDLAVDAAIWWGAPIRGHVNTVGGPRGAFLTFPTSVQNPPLRLTLQHLGWVDFGTGIVPPFAADALGAVLIDARSLHRPSPPVDLDVDSLRDRAVLVLAQPLE